MATGVAITGTVNHLINEAATRLDLPKESLVHCVLVLALTDPAFMTRVEGFSVYFNKKGSESLDKMGL